MTYDCVFIWFLNIKHIKLHDFYPINDSNTLSKVKSNKQHNMLFIPLFDFFGTNIIIDRIIDLFIFMQSYQYCCSNSLFHHHIYCTSRHNLTNFFVKDELCHEYKKVEVVEHLLHKYCLLRIWLTLNTSTDDLFQMTKSPS